MTSVKLDLKLIQDSYKNASIEEQKKLVGWMALAKQAAEKTLRIVKPWPGRFFKHRKEQYWKAYEVICEE